MAGSVNSRRSIRGQSAVGARERQDRRACVLKTFAKCLGRDLQRLRRARHLQDLAEDVRKPVWPVEALQHAERASNSYFLDRERPLGVQRSVRRQTVRKILGEGLEGQVQALDRALRK